MKLHLLPLAAALAIGNFIWQAIYRHQWEVAFERSYFQAAALFILWLQIPKQQPNNQENKK